VNRETATHTEEPTMKKTTKKTAKKTRTLTSDSLKAVAGGGDYIYATIKTGYTLTSRG
jgi:hypothetical protein